MFCCCLGQKLSTLISCEQALHLGDKVKTGRARGTREETRKRGVGVVGGCPRAALFVRPNRKACSQASTLRTLLPLASGSSHDPPPPPTPSPAMLCEKTTSLHPSCSKFNRERMMWELLVLLIPLYHVKCPSTFDIYCRQSSNSPD